MTDARPLPYTRPNAPTTDELVARARHRAALAAAWAAERPAPAPPPPPAPRREPVGRSAECPMCQRLLEVETGTGPGVADRDIFPAHINNRTRRRCTESGDLVHPDDIRAARLRGR